MASDGDKPVILPAAPPPRPAARRAAIEAALRRFDGESASPAAAGKGRAAIRWASLNRRPAGALVAAAVVAIVGIPAIQVALREPPPAAPAADAARSGDIERRQPGPAMPRPETAEDAALPPLAGSTPTAGNAAAPTRPAPPSPADAMTVAEERPDFTASDEYRAKAQLEAPVAATRGGTVAPPPAAPALSPPPPPAAEGRAEAVAEDSVMVTGTRAARPRREAVGAAVVTDPYADFLMALRSAIRTGDRGAMLSRVGFPLKVIGKGGARTYRSASELEEDYELVFTPSVRGAILSLRPGSLESREGGRLRGTDGLWFGCGQPACTAGSAIRLLEITP